MTPFQQLRVWLRRASAGERAGTVGALVVGVALVGWLILPVHRGSGSQQLQAAAAPGRLDASGGGARPGSPESSGATTPTGPGGSEALPGSTGPSGPSATAPGGGTGGGAVPGNAGPSSAGTVPGSTSQCPPGSGPGVTATKVDVAITIIDIVGAAGNEAVQVPSPAEQEGDWQHVADDINASGGAGCRQLIPHFFSVNPIDTNAAQQTCLRIAASNPFIVLDTGALTQVGASDCVPAQKIPLASSYVTQDQLNKYYPFYLSPTGLQVDGYRNGFPGAQQKGYFSAANGFKKLGIIFRSCRPGLVAGGRAAIRQAGIPDSATVAYDLGCQPGGKDSPADDQQAVLAFKSAGVTHVTELDDGDWAAFTKVAGQQNFKPHYVLASDQDANGTSGAYAPDSTNLDGAVDIVGGRYGEQNTPGYQPSAGTARCNTIFAKYGQPPVYRQGAGYGGVVCHYLWFITALFNHAPQLQRSSVVAGMHSIGALDSPFPYGPVNYSTVAPGSPYGRESWRVDKYSKTCECWQVADPVFHLSTT